MPRILFLGDIIGKSGIDAVRRTLPSLKKQFQPDFTFANIENSADGFGVTRNEAEAMIGIGIDACTSGNHVFDQAGYEQVFAGDLPVIRPLNWPGNVPGRGDLIIEKSGTRVLLLNVLGRLFMDIAAADPFAAVEKVLSERAGTFDIAVLDVHAETTSEKRVMAELFDGKIHLIVGTHTHVQTNDARTLPKGTGFLTDLGMCGPERSIIGFEIDAFTRRMRTNVDTLAPVAEGPCEIAGCIADVQHGSTDVQTFRMIG